MIFACLQAGHGSTWTSHGHSGTAVLLFLSPLHKRAQDWRQTSKINTAHAHSHIAHAAGAETCTSHKHFFCPISSVINLLMARHTSGGENQPKFLKEPHAYFSPITTVKRLRRNIISDVTWVEAALIPREECAFDLILNRSNVQGECAGTLVVGVTENGLWTEQQDNTRNTYGASVCFRRFTI